MVDWISWIKILIAEFFSSVGSQTRSSLQSRYLQQHAQRRLCPRLCNILVRGNLRGDPQDYLVKNAQKGEEQILLPFGWDEDQPARTTLEARKGS